MMKHLLFLIALAATTISISAEAGVNVPVSVGEPAFYGAIDVGNAPPPVVYSPQPVVIQSVPVGLPPVYLRVPPEHRRHWERHCAEYNACGRPVYFVKDRWYSEVYVPHYQQHHAYYQERREYEDRREHEHH